MDDAEVFGLLFTAILTLGWFFIIWHTNAQHEIKNLKAQLRRDRNQYYTDQQSYLNNVRAYRGRDRG